MFLRFGHAVSNDIGNALKIPVPPEPYAAREIGADGRANAVCTMTTCTSGSGNFSVKYLPAECDLFRRRPRRHWEVGRSTRIGMHALGRKGVRRGFGFGGLRGCVLDRSIRIAAIGHAPDPAGLIVGNI